MTVLYVRDIISINRPPEATIEVRLFEVVKTRRYPSGAVRLSGDGQDKFGQTNLAKEQRVLSRIILLIRDKSCIKHAA